MLIRVERGDTSEEDFIRKNGIPKEFVQDTEYDEGSNNIIESSSTATATDIQASRVNWTRQLNAPLEEIDPEIANTIELETDRQSKANMDVPISKIEIKYLIDAAEEILPMNYIPEYIPYRLFKEARKTLGKFKEYQDLLIGPAENTVDLESRISEGLSYFEEDKECPEYYIEMSIIQILVDIYGTYNQVAKHKYSLNIDELREEDEKHKKWGFLSENYQELEGRSLTRETVLTVSKVLRTALKMLCRVARGDISEEVFIQENEIPKELLQDTEYDEEGSNETYSIIPFDGRADLLPTEVKEAIDSLKWDIEAESSPTRGRDVLDCLQKFFGFQESSVSNQRENIVNLLSNELMRLGTPGERETAFDKALQSVFDKSLGNYIEWCRYLNIDPIWENTDVRAINKEKKILYICLYYLIWGEAANVRFLPECLCYIFHHMGERLDDKYFIVMSGQLDVPHVGGSFIDQVIQPLYEVIAAEAKIKKEKNVSHSKWRNYDDFNEYFWSKDCLELSWPLNGSDSPFFSPPEGSTTVFGKTSFVEHRTIWHLYHSFHRMWIFHVMMFQALGIFAFNDGELNLKTLTETLTVTYFLMKLIQSILDIWLKYGAYSNTSCVDVLRILARFFWSMLATLIMCFPRMKCLQEKTSSIEESIGFKNYIIVLGVYAFSKISFSISYQFLPQIYENSFVAPLIKWINQEEYVGRGMGEKRTDIFRYMIFWIVTLGINVALTYYGLIRPLVRATRDITDVSKNIHNMLAIGSLWAGVICAYIVGSHVSYNVTSAVVGTFVGHKDRLGNIKFLGDVHKCFDKIPTAFMDHSRESPLENNQEDLDAAEFSPFWNKIVMNLREEDYISDLEQYALSMPEKSGCIDVIQWPLFLLVGKVFHAIRLLQSAQQRTQSRRRVVWERLLQKVQQLTQSRLGRVWDSLLQRLQQQQHTQKDLWNKISRDDVYMKYAVEECFYSVKFILHSVLNNEGKEWVEDICNDIESSIARDGNLCPEFQLEELNSFVKAISELINILMYPDDDEEYVNKVLKKVIQHAFLGEKKFAGEQISISDSVWPTHLEWSKIKRLHSLLTMKSADHVPRNREARRRLEFFTNSLFMSMPTAKPVREMLSFSVLTPHYEETVLYSLKELQSNNDDGVTLIDYLKNLYPDEWTNYCERDTRYTANDVERYEYRLWASYRGQTLARTVRGTMYYQKALLLQAYREMLIAAGLGVDGLPSTSPVPDVSMDEDTRATLNTLEERSSRGELLVQTSGIKLRDKENYNPWREQMMAMLESEKMTGFVDGSLRDPDPNGESQDEYVWNYSQKWKKLDKQVMEWIRDSLSESMYDSVEDSETAKQMWDALKEIIRSQCLDNAKAHVDLKFTYVVSCQIYGKQKSEGKDVAADIAFLLKKNEGLRVAFIDEVFNKEGYKEFYSKLVKADKNGKEMKVYSIKLPGDPKLGEGKPENQNHAIVFTRGKAIQTIDMNQDNYFEETLKMRNLLEEFHRKHVIRPPTILGIREHIFTGSASSLASFMSNQETGFVTLGQRVIANPLKVRMHYGHPDVFDRVFHITRGGISKASRGINISEDIYAGFNSTLRQGSVTHHEYIQVGKGRDVGFNQIATFEGKVAGGNGEQVLSRDLYRLGQRFDFFRMLSFYYTTVGYYFSSLLMVITLYILLYGNLIMALSGTRVPHLLNDIDMAPEWFLMIVLLPAIYMLLVPYLEQGLEKAVESFLAMFFSLGSIFFAFSLGTRIHWFGRTIIHGGASYQATGRGFVLHHIKFSENYRRYSRSHFVKGMEVLFLLVVYCIYGFHSVRAIYNNLLLLGGLILSISWIVAPFLFDSSPFDRYINSEDREDWKNWLNRKTDEVEKIKRIEDKVKESWEIWWTTELSHIRTPAGRVIETILSLRFFIFPLVVGYKLDVQGLRKSLSNCVIPWICLLVVILFFYEVFYKKKQVIQFFSYNRMETIGALAMAYYYSAFGDMITFTIAILTTILGFISFFSNGRVATIGALAIVCYYSAFGGMLAFMIAIITTIWGFISICVALKPALEIFSLWTPVKYLAWICDTGMRALWFNYTVSEDWGARKPTLEIFGLWTLVTYLAWIYDIGMGALMFKIANMFSQRSIKQYLVRNMFDQNISELLHKSSTDSAKRSGRGF